MKKYKIIIAMLFLALPTLIFAGKSYTCIMTKGVAILPEKEKLIGNREMNIKVIDNPKGGGRTLQMSISSKEMFLVGNQASNHIPRIGTSLLFDQFLETSNDGNVILWNFFNGSQNKLQRNILIQHTTANFMGIPGSFTAVYECT